MIQALGLEDFGLIPGIKVRGLGFRDLGLGFGNAEFGFRIANSVRALLGLWSRVSGCAIHGSS